MDFHKYRHSLVMELKHRRVLFIFLLPSEETSHRPSRISEFQDDESGRSCSGILRFPRRSQKEEIPTMLLHVHVPIGKH